jgi:hypothetical protein
VPDPGSTWLFFLSDLSPWADAFSGPGFARFEVIDGKIPPTGGEAIPAVSAVTGFEYSEVQEYNYAPDGEVQLKSIARRTVDEAAAVIQSAIDEAPLPVWTPAPVPSTTPTIGPVPSRGASN